MPRTLTWLHLSDIHLCSARTGWDARRVIKTMTKDLQEMEHRHGIIPDLIFITGDLAYGEIGSNPGERIKDQFRDAQELVEHIRSAFTREIPTTNIFVVPGNHDVDRTLVTESDTAWLNRDADLPKIQHLIQNCGRQWQLAMDCLSAYTEFLQAIGCDHLLSDQKRLIYSVERQVNGVLLGIVGLNSAWASGGHQKKGELWVAGRWQIENFIAPIESTHLKIALVHHPVNWLREEEDPRLLQQIEQQFDFLLHGHEHQDWINETVHGHVRIAAGACYERSDKPTGYNFVQINLDNGEGKVWLRQYDSTGGGWVDRNVYDKTDRGVWPLNHLKLKGRISASSRVSKSSDISLAQVFQKHPIAEQLLCEFLAGLAYQKANFGTRGEPELSIDYFEAAIALGANDLELWQRLGELYTFLGKSKEGILRQFESVRDQCGSISISL